MAKPYHKNPRQITAKQYEALAIDLAELGDLGGIVHDLNSDEIIGGNQRGRVFDLNACDVVLTEVLPEPDTQGTVAHGYVIWKGAKYAYRQVRWTARQCDRANIVANKRGGTWDFDILADQFEQDDLLAWGFEPFELGIDETEAKGGADTEPQTDRAEELRQLWGTAPGQLWLLDSGKGHPHRLICGDCTDAATVARVMGGEKAQITFTSPPYNLGENVKLSTRNKTQNAYRDGYQDNKTSGDYLELLSSFLDIAMSVSEYQFVNMQLLAGNKVALWEFTYSRRLHLADVAIWAKSNPQPAAAKKVMNSAFEFIFIFASEQEPSRAIATANFHGTFSNVYAGTVNSENVAPDLHSAAFPLSLCSDFLSAFTVKGNTVFEPFLGTGTTLIGCENLARRCCAVEIDPKFAAVCLQRFLDHTGATPVLLGDS